MKHAKIKKAFWTIVQTMTPSDIVNGYFGGSNLTAEYLNDYSADGINRFVADWLDDNLNKHDTDMSTVDIIENPDNLLQECAYEFHSALSSIVGERSEWILQNASTWFDAWGTFYVFANADIACSFIIRADNECEAFTELITRFESAFIVDEENGDTIFNDNGNPCNIDNLVLLGSISGE